MKEISGSEAIARMREIRHNKKLSFELHHLTYNHATGETHGLRVVSRCRLRPSLPKETFALPSDLYLPYTDLDTGEPKTCYKKLIRAVAFPPKHKLLKVNWFIK